MTKTKKPSARKPPARKPDLVFEEEAKLYKKNLEETFTMELPNGVQVEILTYMPGSLVQEIRKIDEFESDGEVVDFLVDSFKIIALNETEWEKIDNWITADRPSIVSIMKVWRELIVFLADGASEG